MPAFPEVRVGEPLQYESLTIFPLFSTATGGVDYVLSDEAISSGAVTVEEVSEGGSVPNLVVHNRADSRVLFVEGEELRGAKQNRILNTSVLVAPHSQTLIPVSCVEQGRWRYSSRQFASGQSHASSKLRFMLKLAVGRSLEEGLGHSSDQGAVWQEVNRQMRSLGSHSDTAAMADTFESYSEKLNAYQEQLKPVPGASGMALAVGGRLVAVDLFDRPETCQKAWKRMLTGVIMDALETPADVAQAQGTDVSRLLDSLRTSDWKVAPAVGEGQEYRCEPTASTHASALVFGDSVLHESAVCAS